MYKDKLKNFLMFLKQNLESIFIFYNDKIK